MTIKQISIAAGVLSLFIFSFFAIKNMSSVDNNTKETRDLYKEMQKEDRGDINPKEGSPQGLPQATAPLPDASSTETGATITDTKNSE